MTEQEAKTKWCPFARIPVIGDRADVTCNRANADADKYANCIGSRCMAWRWMSFTPHATFPASSKAIAEDHVAQIEKHDIGAAPQIGGYCGLAGEP